MSELAKRFAEARLAGATVEGVDQLTLKQGYAIADTTARLLGTSAGWKIGATNAGGQKFLGVGEPICGRIFDGIVMSGETLTLPGLRDAEAEPEVLFKLASGSEPGGEMPTIAAAYLGIEINRPSHDDAFGQGVGFIVADNAAHAALVVGPEIDLALLHLPDTIGVKLIRNGSEAASGDASAVLGNPLAALHWLASRRVVKAGDWIATGAITRSCPFTSGDCVIADFGPLGRVLVRRSCYPKVMPVACK